MRLFHLILSPSTDLIMTYPSKQIDTSCVVSFTSYNSESILVRNDFHSAAYACHWHIDFSYGAHIRTCTGSRVNAGYEWIASWAGWQLPTNINRLMDSCIESHNQGLICCQGCSKIYQRWKWSVFLVLTVRFCLSNHCKFWKCSECLLSYMGKSLDKQKIPVLLITCLFIVYNYFRKKINKTQSWHPLQIR